MNKTSGKHKLNRISKTVAYTTLVVATARHRKSLKLYSRCRVF